MIAIKGTFTYSNDPKFEKDTDYILIVRDADPKLAIAIEIVLFSRVGDVVDLHFNPEFYESTEDFFTKWNNIQQLRIEEIINSDSNKFVMRTFEKDKNG